LKKREAGNLGFDRNELILLKNYNFVQEQVGLKILLSNVMSVDIGATTLSVTTFRITTLSITF
jgi:hypothetical protein